jgi:hypothetical protein
VLVPVSVETQMRGFESRETNAVGLARVQIPLRAFFELKLPSDAFHRVAF